MVRRVVWTADAIRDRERIFRYWNSRNQSFQYSKKLFKLFQKREPRLLDFPKAGKSSSNIHVYYIRVKEYRLYYRIESEDIAILRIWDSRQDPDKQPFE